MALTYSTGLKNFLVGEGGLRRVFEEAVPIDKDDYPGIPYTAQKFDAAGIRNFALSGSGLRWGSKMRVFLGGGRGSPLTRPKTTIGFRI